MWNYQLILPDFIILAIFFVYYFWRPRLPIKRNKVFLQILILNLAVLCLDVLSSFVLEHNERFSVSLMIFLNTLYFIFFILISYTFYVFSETIIGLRTRRYSKHLVNLTSYPIFIVSEAIAFLNFFTSTIFSISSDGKYSRGIFYNEIYICAFFYLFLSIFKIFIYRKKINRYDFASALAFNGVLIAGYTFRIIFPNFLIMNFFILISIIIICISFENPLLFMTHKGKSFNKVALHEIFKEYKGKKLPDITAFVINNYNYLKEIYNAKQMETAVDNICIFLEKTFPDYLSFYLDDGKFVLIGKRAKSFTDVKSVIYNRFLKSWEIKKNNDIYLEVNFVLFDPALMIYNPEKIDKALTFAFTQLENLENTEFLINDDTIKNIDENSRIKRSLEIALEKDKVEMFLQPLIECESGKLVAAEALARIYDENDNLLQPGLFIPIAEKNGQITRLGEQMFEKACKFIHENDIEKIGLSWINVNLSPIQFLRLDLNQRFSDILKKYNVPAEKIHLEITEEAIIDFSILQKQIQTMRKSGFQFVLDDYGSGYSNVSRLKSCPFINVKLDMEIVWDYFKNQDKILPTLVQTFKQMNFTITAEGVETQEMADEMKKIGCDYLQGYHFSKPVSVTEFLNKYAN